MKNETIYVGVDPSVSNTGLCVLREESPPEFVNIGSGGKHPVKRYGVISNRVVATLTKFEAKKISVGYEDYSYDSINRSYTLGELGGVLKLSLLSLGTPVQIFLMAPKTVKLFATGRGDATKDMMLKQMHEELDTSKVDTKITSDVADAYFLALYARYFSQPNVIVNDPQAYRALLRHRLSITRATKPHHQSLNQNL